MSSSQLTRAGRTRSFFASFTLASIKKVKDIIGSHVHSLLFNTRLSTVQEIRTTAAATTARRQVRHSKRAARPKGCAQHSPRSSCKFFKPTSRFVVNELALSSFQLNDTTFLCLWLSDRFQPRRARLGANRGFDGIVEARHSGLVSKLARSSEEVSEQSSRLVGGFVDTK